MKPDKIEHLQSTIYEQLFLKGLSKADRRKIQILESAIQTYATLGIEYVSYEDIARTAGISRPLVQHHFPDKKQLFSTVVKLVRAQFQELAVKSITREKEPFNQLKEYVRSTFYWLEQKPTHAHVWLFFFYLCPMDPEFKKLNSELTSMGQKRIAALLENGAKEGVFAKGDFTKTARSIQRLITGALVELETERAPGDRKRVREEVVDAVLQLAGRP